MLEVELARISDVPAIAKLEKALFSDPWSEQMIADCLEQGHYRVIVCFLSPDCVLVPAGAKLSIWRRPVGYLISTHVAGEAELLRIGVESTEQRRGIGRLLMRTFVQLCEESETPEAYLEVRASNLPAITLYDRFGFSVVGTRKNYYHHPDEDACLMTGVMRDLSGGVGLCD